jgi:hypothetical protein
MSANASDLCFLKRQHLSNYNSYQTAPCTQQKHLTRFCHVGALAELPPSSS